MADHQGTDDFTTMVRQHQSMVFSIAYHLVHDRALAEEIAQDVFVQFYKALPSLRSEEHAVSWLRRVAVHRAIDQTRRRGARPEVPLEEVAEPATRPAEDDLMLSRRLRDLVASLPEKTRSVVVLRYQEDMGPEEISTTLEMPVATVKSHLQRGLAMLREKLTRALREARA
ncbi:MAG TPA: sigma-70 family RNA polymerase sigma factor [Terriglobales bacterium]|nr:sigma-70 family RNA polymerase sigma factor [Terriglobales bacterium]